MPLDEILVEPKPVYLQIARRPADTTCHVLQVLFDEVGDMEPTGIVIAAIEQDDFFALSLPIGKPLHHRGATMKIAPTATVGQCDVKGLADRTKQTAQIDFLDHHFEVGVLLSQKLNGK